MEDTFDFDGALKIIGNARKSINSLSRLLSELEQAIVKATQTQTLFDNKEEAEDIFKHMKHIFVDFYKKNKNIEYIWSAKDAFHLNQIKNKIFCLSKNDKSIDIIDVVWQVVLEATKKNEWIFANLSVALINSKFNELVILAKDKGDLDDPYSDYLNRLMQKLGWTIS